MDRSHKPINKINISDIVQKKQKLVLIKSIPAETEITNIQINSFYPSSVKLKLNKDIFFKSLPNIIPLQPDDDTIYGWHYSPMYDITFQTKEGYYYLNLFLGGLGLIQLPDGKIGAIKLKVR